MFRISTLCQPGCVVAGVRESWCAPSGTRWRRRSLVRRSNRGCVRCIVVATRCVRVSRPGETGLLHVVGVLSATIWSKWLGRAVAAAGRSCVEVGRVWRSGGHGRWRCGLRCGMAGTRRRLLMRWCRREISARSLARGPRVEIVRYRAER